MAANRSLALLPSNQDGWMGLGLALAQEQKFTEAAGAFQRVFQLDSQAVWGRYNLGLCLEKLGHREEAIRKFKRALALRPAFGMAWLGLSQLYEEMGRKDGPPSVLPARWPTESTPPITWRTWPAIA